MPRGYTLWSMTGSDRKSGSGLREADTLNETEDEESGEIQRVVPMDAVPWLIITFDQLRHLPIDPRAGFLVSLIDGRSTVEMITDVAGLPKPLTLRILAKLLALKAIELRPRKTR